MNRKRVGLPPAGRVGAVTAATGATAWRSPGLATLN